MSDPASGPSSGTKGFFDRTQWSTVLKAKAGEDEERQAALERLLTRYRRPIFLHILASLPNANRSPEIAEDLTQEFIFHCLRLNFLKQVAPNHGRFRTFIKTCIRNFLRDQHGREAAQKRGGGQRPASLDETDGEGNRMLEPSGPAEAPETVLDREWALSVLDGAMELLREECVTARRAELFEALKGHLDRAPAPGTAKEIGARLGMSEEAVNTAMNRMRARLGEHITTEIRQTVTEDQDWREELKYLIELLGH